jgi:hypothetical protein
MHYIPDLQNNIFRNVMARHPGAAQSKWSRLTAKDLASATTEEKLIECIERRYHLGHGAAVSDVTIWARSQT